MNTADYTVSRPRIPAALVWFSTLVVGFGAMVVSAKINVPMYPVPMTLQTFAVILIGIFAPQASAAIMATVLYAGAAFFAPPLILSAGFPVATGGYILGFISLAAAISLWKTWSTGSPLRDMSLFFGLALVGHAVVYGAGLAWLHVASGLSGTELLAAGLFPFLLGDATKVLFAVFIGMAASAYKRTS